MFIKSRLNVSICSNKMIFILSFLSIYILLNGRMLQDIISPVLSKVISFLFFGRMQIARLNDFKYVLLWDQHFLSMSIEENADFSLSNCSTNNCIFTSDRNLFGGNCSFFDAIVYESEVSLIEDVPPYRLPSQLYVFTTIESSRSIPACEPYYDDFFNWTFTYKLDSDIPWTYFVVKNDEGGIVAPKDNVRWQTSMKPIKPEIKTILNRKTKAVMWFVSDCKSRSIIEDYVLRLQDHLYHYSLNLDVYGGCDKTHCPNDNCKAMIRDDYFFYLAFENTFLPDYVTEKVLYAYDNYAVPIVFGGANYSRFLPPGSYLSAINTHPYNLAYAIYEAVMSPEIYENYFVWTNLYTVELNLKVYNPLCDFCKALHSKKAKNAPAKKNFRDWWNGSTRMKWCVSGRYWNESSEIDTDYKTAVTAY